MITSMARFFKENIIVVPFRTNIQPLNTSLPVAGALTNRMQRHTDFNMQNGCQGGRGFINGPVYPLIFGCSEQLWLNKLIQGAVLLKKAVT